MVASAASPCSLYFDDDGCHGEYDDSDDTSDYESNSEDDQRPAAKSGPAEQVLGCAFSPKVEALGILKQFIKKQFSPMLPHLFTQPSGLDVPSLPPIVCSPRQGGQLLEGSTPIHFNCSFHRRQNITKIVKGGNVKYSCLWLFNKLVKAHTKQETDHIKHKHS